MNLLPFNAVKYNSDVLRINLHWVGVKGPVHQFALLLVLLFFFASQAFSQDEGNSRLKDLSGTYFIENESQITGNIKRRIQIEEDRINETESIVSILSEGQEVFTGRRHTQTTEITGVWSYVHYSKDPQLNQLQKDRNCTLTFETDGEKFTMTMRQIKLRPAGGMVMGMLQAIDQSSKGVDANTAAKNIQWEIAFEKSVAAVDRISFIRKKVSSN